MKTKNYATNVYLTKALFLLLLCVTARTYACLDVVAICGADPHGVENSTHAIRACINLQEQDNLCFPKGTYRLSSNLWFPGRLSLHFDAGAKFVVDAGVTVKLNGHVDASPHLHFDGDGTYLFQKRSLRTMHADWFPSLQKAIDAVPGVTPRPGGGGDAVIQLSPKTYFENVVIGGENETKDIRLVGAGRYHSVIQGRDTGPSLRVENSRVQLSDFYACNTPGSGYNAIELINSSTPGGLGGVVIERVGVCGAGLDGIFINEGVRFWLKDLTIYNMSRHAITLGTASTKVSEISIANVTIRDVEEGNYGLNLVNAQMVRATGRIERTTTMVNLGGAGERIYLDLWGEDRDWEGYRQ